MKDHEISNFEVDVLQRSYMIPVVVDFWAEWCAPCKVLGPILERLAAMNDGRWALAKVDTEQYQEVAGRYGIRAIPNVKLFVDGNVASEFTGALPERAVVQWLQKSLPSRFKKDLERARQFLVDGKGDEAVRILESVLQQDGGNEEARVLLARSIFRTNSERARNLVAGIEESSEFFPLADAVRTILDLVDKLKQPDTLADDPVKLIYLDAICDMERNNFDGALGKFIAVIRQNRMYDDDGSRKACVAIFRILGEESEITRKHRRDFGNALNV